MKLYIKVLFIISLALGACDDGLQIVPESSLSVNGFYQTEEDAQSAINGMYAQMRSVANGMYLYGEWRADHSEQTDLGTGSDIMRNTIQSDDGGTDWSGFYRLINDANLIITLVPDIEFTSEEDRGEILAQAYFTRAWAYFQVVRIWGEAPVLTDGFLSPEQDGILPGQRDAVNMVFDQIKADIQSSIDNFSSDGITSRYTANVVAANTLKADIYLWTAKQEGGGSSDLNVALQAINAVVGHGDLTLVGYDELFRTESATGADIFSLYRDNIEGGNFWTSGYMLQRQNYSALSAEEQARIPFMESGARFYAPTQQLRDQFLSNSALGNGAADVREGIIVQSYDLEIISGEDTTLDVREHLVKFLGDEGADGRRYTDDNKLYRYADAILIRAEINNALGNGADAVADLNMTRNRAGIGDYAGGMSQDEIDDAILLEKAVEFAFEARRFFDLVRNNRAYTDIPSLIGREGEQPILWPISDFTISQNPNLSQTPGY